MANNAAAGGVLTGRILGTNSESRRTVYVAGKHKLSILLDMLDDRVNDPRTRDALLIAAVLASPDVPPPILSDHYETVGEHRARQEYLDELFGGKSK